MPKLTFQWNSVPKLTLGAGVHRLVPKLFRAGVTRTEHRLPRSSFKDVDDRLKIVIMTKYFVTKITKACDAMGMSCGFFHFPLQPTIELAFSA